MLTVPAHRFTALQRLIASGVGAQKVRRTHYYLWNPDRPDLKPVHYWLDTNTWRIKGSQVSGVGLGTLKRHLRLTAPR